MRTIFLLFILGFTVQSAFGQACGIYKVKYVGKIDSELMAIEKIKLPTIEFLHGLEDFDSVKGFVEIKPMENEFNFELRSNLTSHLYEKTESLINFYKSKREYIPIFITVNENGKYREIQLELTWNDVNIKSKEDESFENLFEFDLNEISIE